MEDFIRLEHITKRFGGLTALNDVSFSIKSGEALGLCGANGSGKSTIIKILAGVLKPDSGSLFIEGEKISGYDSLAGIRKGISVIYQDLSLFPTLTVLENICLMRLIEQRKIISVIERERGRVQAILDDLGVSIKTGDIAGELPIASQQLIAIARALNNDSKLIVLDEPTTALTGAEISLLFKIIGKLKNSGISVIFVSHKTDEIMEICDKVTVLRDGMVVASKSIAETGVTDIETLIVGQAAEYPPTENLPADARPVMEVKKLSRKNNFKDISFTLRHGEILGVIGLLGSGRTELAQSLFGMFPADSGEIFIDGEMRVINSVQKAVKSGIAYVPEDRLSEGLVIRYPIKDNTVLATLDAFRNKLTFLDNAKIKETAERWINTLSTKAASSEHPVSSLSGGNQQKVVLAKWLESNPKVLILDGPTVGIDIGSKIGIFKFIKEMVKEKGVGVILISDEIKEIAHNSHRVIIMRNGRIGKVLESNEISEEAIHAILNQQKQEL
ncbi:MAG: sugar ABC transporter ATP-binding protein [Spirochaetaceae bacterium]|jgi:simple sugar transport system ATP-binding protein|nr:sugar ABC transporter ATP-binding protein [Spirochaetaceae bacterium]GMO22579.1 MAG: sugar ABC transporter ATP-binding protein [Termitinemataceae bacterium]